MATPSLLETKLAALPLEELHLLRWRMRWHRQARDKQLPPPEPWSTWGIRSGRGWGKTATGANWLGIKAASNPGTYNFIVAPTHDDLRHVCFEGPTGIDAYCPPELIAHSDKSLPVRVLWNGSVIRGFAAQSPERLRGPQSHACWCDEIASWSKPKLAWDNLKFGHRLGTRPQLLWTSTLKPTPFIRNLIRMRDAVVISGSTYENAENLAPAFIEDLKKYEGLAIGRQEIYGELLDPEDSGYIKRQHWKMWPTGMALPRLHFIVMSLDTAFTESTFDVKEQQGDPTACSVWGVFEQDGLTHVILLDSWEAHLGFPELIKRVKKEREATYGAASLPLADEHGPLFGTPLHGPVRGMIGRPIDLILIEDKGSGISLRQALASEDVLTHPYNPGKADKLARLHAISPMFAAGRVWAVESAKTPGEFRSWAEPLVSQVCTYVGPGSTEHDDLLDTTTQALKYISDRFMGAFTLPPKSKEHKLAEEIAARKGSERVNVYAQ
jgi:phage terminase large subunit-like protein